MCSPNVKGLLLFNAFLQGYDMGDAFRCPMILHLLQGGLTDGILPLFSGQRSIACHSCHLSANVVSNAK